MGFMTRTQLPLTSVAQTQPPVLGQLTGSHEEHGAADLAAARLAKLSMTGATHIVPPAMAPALMTVRRERPDVAVGSLTTCSPICSAFGPASQKARYPEGMPVGSVAYGIYPHRQTRAADAEQDPFGVAPVGARELARPAIPGVDNTCGR